MSISGIALSARWTDSLLQISARYGNSKGGAVEVGSIQGFIDGPGLGFRSDVKVLDQFEVASGLLKLRKSTISLRNRGIGSELLEWFEHEMGTHGVEEVRGNLVPESADKLEGLIGWYQKRGYQFHPGQSVGSFVPKKTAGMITKRIPVEDIQEVEKKSETRNGPPPQRSID